MSRILILLAVITALAVGGCKSTAADCTKAEAERDKNAQSQTNADLFTNVQVGETDADQTNAPTSATIETQSENLNTAPTLTVTKLFGNDDPNGGLAACLTTVTPGEAATLRALTQLEARIAAMQTRIDNDPALLDLERKELEAKLATLETRRVAQITRLDKYAADKIAAAINLKPDLNLESLERIVVQLFSDQRAGAEKGLTDAQSNAMKDAAVAAFGRQP